MQPPYSPWHYTSEAAEKTTRAAKKATAATAAKRVNNTTLKTTWKAASYYFQINHCQLSTSESPACQFHPATDIFSSWISSIIYPASLQVSTAPKDSIVRAFPSMDKRWCIAELFTPRVVDHVVGLLQKIGRDSHMNHNHNKNNSRGPKASNKGKQHNITKGRGTTNESELTSSHGAVETKSVNHE